MESKGNGIHTTKAKSCFMSTSRTLRQSSPCQASNQILLPMRWAKHHFSKFSTMTLETPPWKHHTTTHTSKASLQVYPCDGGHQKSPWPPKYLTSIRPSTTSSLKLTDARSTKPIIFLFLCHKFTWPLSPKMPYLKTPHVPILPREIYQNVQSYYPEIEP